MTNKRRVLPLLLRCLLFSSISIDETFCYLFLFFLANNCFYNPNTKLHQNAACFVANQKLSCKHLEYLYIQFF